MADFMLDKITSEEYNIMHCYRDWYAWYDGHSSNCNVVPIREVLKEWANANTDLYTLLGGNLIISKEFVFEKPEDELRDEMYAMTEMHRTYGREQREGWKFTKEFYNWLNKTYPIYNCYYSWDDDLTPEQLETNRVNIPIRNGLNELISLTALARNTFEGKPFSLTLPDGRTYTVQTGSKPMKVLSKIASAFNLPYFEDFRICHSLVHNQKKIKGDLTLSIHPLDYWTMSDNDCDWDSCMNWRDCGGYRQGTIEMMNSPAVVVAYLKASEPMKIGDMEWTNKKWRQLFIVDKDVILGIKDYPYRNPKLSCAVAKWLKELAETNLGWKYNTEDPEHFTCDTHFTNPNYPEDKTFRFSFSSNHMYTDVGSLDWHPIYVGAEVSSSNINHSKGTEAIYYYNYSGASQCVSCGEINPDLYDDSSLCCSECEAGTRCCECGSHIPLDDAYSLRGSYLCASCWNEYTQYCPCCDGNDFTDNFVTVTFLPRLDDATRKSVEDEFGPIEERLTALGYKHEFPGYEVEICDRCWSEFAERYLKPDCKTFTLQNNYGSLWHGAYVDDLNEDGLDQFMSWRLLDALKNGTTPAQLIDKFWTYDHQIVKILDED